MLLVPVFVKDSTAEVLIALSFSSLTVTGETRSIADSYTQLSDWEVQGLAEGLLSDADLSVAFDMVH